MELEQQLHSGLVPLPSCGLGEVTRSLYASASSLMKGNFLRYKEPDTYFLTILPVSCDTNTSEDRAAPTVPPAGLMADGHTGWTLECGL